MPQTIDPEGAADGEGPNASLDLGQVGQAQDDANALKSSNPAAYAGSQEPGQGGSQGTATPPATPVQATGAPPTQDTPNPPPPKQPFKPQFPDLDEGTPWRKRLDVWANSGNFPYLKHFNNMAKADIAKHGRGKTSGGG